MVQEELYISSEDCQQNKDQGLKAHTHGDTPTPAGSHILIVPRPEPSNESHRRLSGCGFRKMVKLLVPSNLKDTSKYSPSGVETI